MSLITKVRRATASTNDDFFRTEAILQYLNAAKEKVVSEMIRLQTNAENSRSVRALDKLRVVDSTNLSLTDATVTTGYNEESINLPTDLKQIMYVGILNNGSPIQVRELRAEERTLLNWGTIKPSNFQAFYYVSGGTTPKITFYTSSLTTANVWLHYIKEPTAITVVNEATTALDDIPVQLHNAIIYGACEQMAIQEKSANTQNFSALYQEELELNAY
jgi:hypothetical protein